MKIERIDVGVQNFEHVGKNEHSEKRVLLVDVIFWVYFQLKKFYNGSTSSSLIEVKIQTLIGLNNKQDYFESVSQLILSFTFF